MEVIVHHHSLCYPRSANIAENPERVVFDYSRFIVHRTRLEVLTNSSLPPKNIVDCILEPRLGNKLKPYRELFSNSLGRRNSNKKRRKGREPQGTADKEWSSPKTQPFKAVQRGELMKVALVTQDCTAGASSRLWTFPPSNDEEKNQLVVINYWLKLMTNWLKLIVSRD